jgi:hypothetical protein
MEVILSRHFCSGIPDYAWAKISPNPALPLDDFYSGLQNFQRLVPQGISDQLRRGKGIEATSHLAESSNFKSGDHRRQGWFVPGFQRRGGSQAFEIKIDKVL